MSQQELDYLSLDESEFIEFDQSKIIQLAFSKLLERSGYYGVRSLIVLYMVSDSFGFSESDAVKIYGYFTSFYVISQVLGALLGDFLIGNRKAAIVGGILQSLGAFMFCIPSELSLYGGLVMISLGSGLYGPNLFSQFGQEYQNSPKKIDSGFTFFYLAINLGAFLGVVGLSLISENFGWNTSFIAAGSLSALAIILLKMTEPKVTTHLNKPKKSIPQRIIQILIMTFSVALFWSIYGFALPKMLDLQIKFQDALVYIPSSLFNNLSAIFTLPIGIIFLIIWLRNYSSQWFKLTVGFSLGTASLLLLFLIAEVPSFFDLIVFIISVAMMAAAEIHISPILNAFLAQNTRPKYLATISSLVFLPNKLLNLLFGVTVTTYLAQQPTLSLQVSAASMSIVGVLVLFCMITLRKKHIV